MAIEKKRGASWGVNGLTLQVQGPARQVAVCLTLAKSQGYGHTDPAGLPSATHFFQRVSVPAALEAPAGLNVGRIAFTFPGDAEAGATYDVNLAVGPADGTDAPSTFASWFAKRHDDDWDDAVYKVPADLAASASLPVRTGDYF